MSPIVLIDTSIYLNILDIQGFNQQRQGVLSSFEEKINAGYYFLLPIVSIFETGNHISKLANGQTRRKYATILVNDTQKAIKGENPYRATFIPDQSKLLEWLNDFPDRAMRNKAEQKQNEGTSLADSMIVSEWLWFKKTCPMSQVEIWSLDQDLASYQ